jgi:hypothetical protein
MSNGLTAAYAYELAYERGLVPTRDEKLLGRSHSARLAHQHDCFHLKNKGNHLRPPEPSMVRECPDAT